MNTATCNWTTMRVIDYFWLLLLPLLCLTNQAQALSCIAIVDGSSFEKFEKCTLEAGPFFGNPLEFVRLDFSTAKGDQITDFFAQANADERKTPTLSAAFRLVDNKDITQIDFGNIETWTVLKAPDGEPVIEIVSNPNFNEIKIDALDSITFVGNFKGLVHVYNNPQLTWKTETMEKIRAGMSDDSYFETELHACTFQNPLDKKKAIAPTAELMEKCQIFKGDLNLEESALKDEITFKDGCLRLVNVDMTKITNITAENGQEQCIVDGVTPEIKNNPGLCGDKMATVAEYAPKAAIQLHKTCTISCKDQATVDHKFYRCNKIDADGISLNQWFTSENSNVGGQLTEAKGISVKAGGPKVTKISMPALKSVDKLEITDNSDLKILELPSLQDVKMLTIKNNDQLTLDGIRKMPKNITVGQAEVECNTHEYLVIADIDQLRHCTKIIGPLIIRNALFDVDPTKFNISEVVGCVTVESSDLSNLGFLDKAEITCNGQHTLSDNKNLCKPRFLGREKGAEITASGLKPTGCGKECRSLSEKDCVVVNRDLTVNDKTRPADIALLEAINGRLTITGAGPSLEFPVLATINSSKAPALLVSNNPNLASLKMPQLEKINPNGPMPKVKIENSPKLTDLKQFLPTELADSCNDPASTTCQYDMAQKKEESDNTGLIVGVSTGAIVIVALLIAAAVFVWCCWLKKKKEKASGVKAKSEDEALEKADNDTKIANDPEAGAAGALPDGNDNHEAADARAAPILAEKNSAEKKENSADKKKNSAEKKENSAGKKTNSAEKKENSAGKKKNSAEKKKNSAEKKKNSAGKKKNSAGKRTNSAGKRTNSAGKILGDIIKVIFEPPWTVLDNIETRFPATNQVTYLRMMGDMITKLPHGPIQFRILLRGERISDFEDFDRIRDKANRIETDRIGLNKHVFLDYELYSHNFLKFLEPLRFVKPMKIEHLDEESQFMVRLIHIGPGFVEAMKYNKNMKLTLMANMDGEPFMKVHKTFPCLSSSYYLMEYTGGDYSLTCVVELTEMNVPEFVIGQLESLIKCPWFNLLHYAWKSNIVIHTSVPEYLVCSHYIYTGIDQLNRRIHVNQDVTEVQFQSFALATMYPAYHEIFAGADPNFDEITPFTIYVACMLEYAAEYSPNEEKYKDAVKRLIDADKIIFGRWKANKTDTIAWDIPELYTPLVEPAEPAVKREDHQKYYNANRDKTPYRLYITNKLKYPDYVGYHSEYDNLMHPQEPTFVEDGKKKDEKTEQDELEGLKTAKDDVKKEERSKKGSKKSMEEKKETSKEGGDEKKEEKKSKKNEAQKTAENGEKKKETSKKEKNRSEEPTDDSIWDRDLPEKGTDEKKVENQ